MFSGIAQPLLELVEINREDELLKRIFFEGYEPEPGS